MTIESTLNELYTVSLQFKSILDQEKNILEKNQFSLLEKQILEKEKVIHHIQEIASHMKKLLDQKETPYEKSIIKLIDFAPWEKKKKLFSQWKEIKEILKTCEQNNLRNGALITMLKNYNDAFLKLLNRGLNEGTYTKQTDKLPLAISTREHKA